MIELPTCRWRGEETIEGYHECSSPKLHHGPNGVRDELCLGCYLRDHEPEQYVPPPKKYSACINLGELTGERRQCPSCNGNVEVKLMTCSVYGSCTIGKKIDGIACCQGCPDYAAG